MSTTAQSITLSTGAVVPVTCDQHTPLDLLPLYVDAYHTLAGGAVALDTIRQVVDAMRDSAAIVALYTDGKCETMARGLWPNSVTLTKDSKLTCRAYCTLRREWRTFRIDRMIAVHPLTTPDDEASQTTAPPAPPSPDPARLAVSIGRALVNLQRNVALDAADTALVTSAIDNARRLYVAVATA